MLSDLIATLIERLYDAKNLDNIINDKFAESLCGKESTVKKIRRPYVIDGKQIWLVGETEQDVADKYADAIVKARGLGPVRDVGKHRLCDMIDRWFEYKTTHRKIGIRTATNYATHITTIKQHFAGRNVEDIKWSDVQAFLDQYSNQAKSTVRHKQIILSQVFQWAVEDNMIATNPARDSRIEIPNTSKRRPAVPMDKYLEICGHIGELEQERDKALMALIAYTGMRRGEALAIRWEDIDWDNGIVSISRALIFDGNRPLVKGPKSEAGKRKFPMIDELRNILYPMRKASGIIVSVDGITYYTGSCYARAWERISRQIEMYGFTAHSFRHTIASICAASSEISPKTLQTIMGHADIATTLNIYAETGLQAIMDAGIIFSNRLSKQPAICSTSCIGENAKPVVT